MPADMDEIFGFEGDYVDDSELEEDLRAGLQEHNRLLRPQERANARARNPGHRIPQQAWPQRSTGTLE